MYDPKLNKKYVGIIVDRNGPDNSCKVFLPEIHGVNVKVEDLGWSRFVVPPGGSEGATSYGTPDNGQLVTCTVNTTGGSTLVEITGLYQTKQTSDPANPDNMSLNLVFPQWALALQTTSNIRVPPSTIKEETVDGVKVRVPEERNQLHSHSLLMGINSTAALPPLNGSILPSLTVGTAVQPSSTSLSDSMINSLMPSPSTTMAGLFSSTILSSLSGVLPPAIFSTLASTTALMTTVQPSSTSITIKPNVEVVLRNANNMLANCRTSEDVQRVVFQLTTNTQLQNEETKIKVVPTMTPYGEGNLTVDLANGTVSLSLSNAAQAMLDAFSSVLSAINGADGQMFGNSSPVIQSMGERLVDEAKKAEFKTRTTDNASDTQGTQQRVLADQKAISFVTG